MGVEAKLQSEIIKFLRSKGCFVMKVPSAPGVPIGTPDVFFCLEGCYGFIEVKSSKTAKFQPYQKERIKKFNEWSWAKTVYPDNWPTIKEELALFL